MKVGLGFDLNTTLASYFESVYYTNNVQTSEAFDIYIPLKIKGIFLEPKISYIIYKIEFDYDTENHFLWGEASVIVS